MIYSKILNKKILVQIVVHKIRNKLMKVHKQNNNNHINRSNNKLRKNMILNLKSVVGKKLVRNRIAVGLMQLKLERRNKLKEPKVISQNLNIKNQKRITRKFQKQKNLQQVGV